MARNAVGAAEELLRHQPGQLVEKVRIMKTLCFWLVVLAISFDAGCRDASALATGLFLVVAVAALTASARVVTLKKLRGAFVEWQRFNNERHRALALVECKERARTDALEQLGVERELTFDATCKLMLLKEFTDAFVTPETIRERLQKLAVEFKWRCDLQQAFYRSAGERINGGTSGFEGEAAIAAAEASFNAVKRQEAAHRMLVDDAKQSFWKQHDLVGNLIELGLLSPLCRVLEGKSFTKYLPSEPDALQKLGVHVEGANEQPGQ